MSKPIILDLCGGTGAWSAPYAESGKFDVRIITLPDIDVNTYDPPESGVYGVLAAPPCTMFSLARTKAKTPRDLRNAMQTVYACLRIVWEIRAGQKERLHFWALENSRGLLRQFLGKPAFSFHPWEFGENYTKATDLWGYFNEPKKLRNFNGTNRGLQTLNGDSALIESMSNLKGSAAKRAITPRKFAEAFYEANSDLYDNTRYTEDEGGKE